MVAHCHLRLLWKFLIWMIFVLWVAGLIRSLVWVYPLAPSRKQRLSWQQTHARRLEREWSCHRRTEAHSFVARPMQSYLDPSKRTRRAKIGLLSRRCTFEENIVESFGAVFSRSVEPWNHDSALAGFDSWVCGMQRADGKRNIWGFAAAF